MIQELCALTKQRMMSEVEERMRRLQEEAIITKLSAGTIIDAVHSQRSEEGDGERERILVICQGIGGEGWESFVFFFGVNANESALFVQRVTQERESIVDQSSSCWRNERSQCL